MVAYQERRIIGMGIEQMQYEKEDWSTLLEGEKQALNPDDIFMNRCIHMIKFIEKEIKRKENNPFYGYNNNKN